MNRAAFPPHRVDYIGNNRSPVIIVENAWPDAEQLIELAAAKHDYSLRSFYYPGVRSSAPPDYAYAITAQLEPLIADTFGLTEKIKITDSTFSLVATPASKLVPFQRVPHFDSVDQNRFAMLHYLCGPQHGGTSFYRHRSTGVEEVTAENRDLYTATVNAEVKSSGMPPSQFIEGDTPLFERVARYECTFNRILIYRGRFLHSVNMPVTETPDTNPRTGRLTVNTFLLAGAEAAALPD
jgi:hypothetical protein